MIINGPTPGAFRLPPMPKKKKAAAPAAAPAAPARRVSPMAGVARTVAQASAIQASLPPCSLGQRIWRALGGSPSCNLPAPVKADMSGYSSALSGLVPGSGASGYETAVDRADQVSPTEYDYPELGIAPFVAAALAPVAVAAGKKIASKISGGKSVPPCTFGQKLSRFFGGKPACK